MGWRWYSFRLLVAALGVVLGLAQSSVRAETVQFRMTGTIEVIRQVGPLPPGLFEKAPFEAILSYDLTMPDEQPDDPKKGRYVPVPPNPDENFLFIRAGESEIRSRDIGLWIGDDVDDVQELFEMSDDTFRLLGAQFTSNFDFVISSLAFTWNDPTRQAYSSDGLPTILDPQSFPDPFIEIATFAIDPRVFQFVVHAHVESIEVIPEPMTFVISMLGIAIVTAKVGNRRIRRVHRSGTCL